MPGRVTKLKLQAPSESATAQVPTIPRMVRLANALLRVASTDR
jgi:hypothetical protein